MDNITLILYMLSLSTIIYSMLKFRCSARITVLMILVYNIDIFVFEYGLVTATSSVILMIVLFYNKHLGSI